jgi:membrane protein YqaA with SNARE-associated domain
LRRRAVIGILGVSATAILSALVLWRSMVNPESLGQFGLIGVFVASLLGHLTVVAKDMFLPMYLSLTSTYHPVALGLAAGTGAALGEVATYVLGWGIAESVGDQRSQTENKIVNWIRRYGLWAVLLVASTPLPDTPIVLIAGSNRLPFRKLLVAELLGKTTLYSVGAVFGGFVFNGLVGVFGGLATSLFTVAVSILFCVGITWERSRELILGWFDSLLH